MKELFFVTLKCLGEIGIVLCALFICLVIIGGEK